MSILACPSPSLGDLKITHRWVKALSPVERTGVRSIKEAYLARDEKRGLMVLKDGGKVRVRRKEDSSHERREHRDPEHMADS